MDFLCFVENIWNGEEISNYKKSIIVLFVETPRKFITAVINLRGVSTNKTIIDFIAMQTYRELIRNLLWKVSWYVWGKHNL
jgi:hypothetical protein